MDEERKTVIEVLKDNFSKTLNIRTLLGSLDLLTVVTVDGKLALNQIGQITIKSLQLILVKYGQLPKVYSRS